MKTGTTNIHLKSLIDELKKKSFVDNTLIWKRIAKDLEKPTRNRRAVNLSRINRFTKKDETIVVPGKVLAAGELDHSVTIVAWQFSQQAIDKITKANAKALSINEIMKQDIKGKKVRIIG